MHNLIIKIGNTIKQRRELLSLKQEQLSALSGISKRTIQLLENGKANPSLETLLQLADPLGLQIKLELKDFIHPNSGIDGK